MKLLILPHVLFDEFPNDENYKTIKFCFFTQPKYPAHDCTKYTGITYCCTKETFHVLRGFKKIPTEAFELLDERKTSFEGTTKFWVRAIRSGNVSKSVMLLIHIENDIHLYTGRFTQCRDAVLIPIALHYKDELNDIHVDNKMANFRGNGLRFGACNRIRHFVEEHDGFNLYLHTELFGFEELLFELARGGMKIKLSTPQLILFQQCGLGKLFEFDGPPQLKLYIDFDSTKPWSKENYENLFDKHRTIHIKLVPMEHQMRPKEQIRGLFLVSYTPHPTSHVLYTLFQTLQPKRVHPLEPQGFNDALMSTIPEDILNDGCVVVDDVEWGGANTSQNAMDNDDGFVSFDEIDDHSTSSRSFLDLSDEYQDSFGTIDELASNLSAKVVHSVNLSETGHQASNGESNQPVDERSEQLSVSEKSITESCPIEILDNDDPNDNILGLVMESNHTDTSLRSEHEANPQLNGKGENQGAHNRTDIDAVQQHDEINNAEIENATAAEARNLPNQSKRLAIDKQNKSNKNVRTRAKKITSHLYRPKPFEYLSDSDGEVNENQSARDGSLQLHEKEPNENAPSETDVLQSNDGGIGEDIQMTTANDSDNLANQSQCSVNNNQKSPQNSDAIEKRTEWFNEDNENGSSSEDETESNTDYLCVFPS